RNGAWLRLHSGPGSRPVGRPAFLGTDVRSTTRRMRSNSGDFMPKRNSSISLRMLIAASLGPAALPAIDAVAQDYTTWRSYAGGAHSSQYSALDQINKSNVHRLEVAWKFPVGERSVLFNPIVVDGVMYVLARDNEIVALDAATGRELWAHPHDGPVTARGINYWESEDGKDKRLIYLNAGFVTALDATTGKTIESFGNGGRVDLRDALAADGRDIS